MYSATLLLVSAACVRFLQSPFMSILGILFILHRIEMGNGALCRAAI